MADTTLNRIAAARRAMEQVVIPAVDADHPLAREQAELVSQTLRLLEEQLPFARERAAYELRGNLDLARALLELADGELRDELAGAVRTGEAVLAALGPSGAELDDAVAALTATASAVVRDAESAPDDVRRAVIGIALTHSRTIITGQRAWFAAQGWGSADGVPSMAALFRRPDEER